MDFFEMLVGDVSVDLGGRDVGVAKHGLDGAEIGAIHEEIGGEAVTEGVGGDVLCDAGGAGVFLDDTFDRTGGEATVITRSVRRGEIFAVIEKKWGERIGASIKVILDPLGGGFRDENWTIFATFAANEKFTTVEVD